MCTHFWHGSGLTLGVFGTDGLAGPECTDCETRFLLPPLRTRFKSDSDAGGQTGDPEPITTAVASPVIAHSRVVSLSMSLRFCSLI